MKKIHFMYQKQHDIWYIIDIDRDYWGAAHNGLISISGAEDVMQADSLTDLLLQLYDNEDDRFYVVQNTIYHDGKERYDKYPHFMSLHPLCGYIREVYEGVMIEKEYGKSYISELWIRDRNTETLSKIRNFDRKSELQKELKENKEANQ